MAKAHDPVSLFKAYRDETAQFRFYTNMTLDDDLRGDLRLFGLFCKRYDVDPVLWIRARHEAIGWNRQIPADQLATVKFLGKYRDFVGDLTARRAADEEVAEGILDDTVCTPLGGLRPHEEAFRAAMHRVKAYDACLASSGYMTGGYCPDSDWCTGCPVSTLCSEATRNRHVRSGRVRPRLSEGPDTRLH